jgi:hypothetical protein
MIQHNWSKDDVSLIKGLYADAGGRRALEFIIEQLGGLLGPSITTDPHVTAFNEGRRFVARELLAAITMPIDKIVQEVPDGRPRVITATERAERSAGGYNAYRNRAR